MFSRKTVLIVGLLVAVTINLIVLSLSSRHRFPSEGIGQLAVGVVAPFQLVVTNSCRFLRETWQHYFQLVSIAERYDQLSRELDMATAHGAECAELRRSNRRLRALLHFQDAVRFEMVAAEVVGKDPSPWFKTVIIDKGYKQGVRKGMPVVVPQGIVGQVIGAGRYFAKVLLIIDANNAVDALVDRTRARGVVTGTAMGQCALKYVLRKEDVRVGDLLISSGMDGVFPKGLRIGFVSGVIRRNSGIFQDVTVTPFVNFEKLEEVLVIRNEPERPKVVATQ